ncbi:PaaI family thioesterase [Ponticoccus alexandrii]|uniref:Hotdog fold thioesterase n=1 Tax=Ponticoccus alexandrii TaxID=1943633 RepID=A0ABX7F5A7_9RHOB|nr:PaaI family thioesterase [Ponticoccus alexandrii]ETA49851.1 phenylacetic acid degradation protein [Rhodobacteraceae bacterium PD-2]QRF65718.1 hotdog fold thioesterase [Ponticoccus alexandrii]
MTQPPFPDEGSSPFARHLGLRMIHWEADRARFEMPLASFLMNRHDNPHGGAHAALLDTVMGYAGCWTGDPERRQMCLTLSLTVQYLSRPKGSLLTGEGRRTGGGRKTFFAEGTVTDETGELIASATGVFRYRA